MASAWLVLAPAGALLARFGKAACTGAAGGAAEQPAKAQPAAWFRGHRALLVGAVALTVVGTAVSYSMTHEHLSTRHATLGTALLVASLLQGANGALRPGKGARHRPLWRAAHRGAGHVTWAFGLLTCISGALLYDSMLDERGQGAGHAATATVAALATAWALAWAALEARASLRRRGVPKTHEIIVIKTEQTVVVGVTTEATPAGVRIVEMNAVGAGFKAGLRVGDMLLSVNGEACSTPEQTSSLLRKAVGRVRVCIERPTGKRGGGFAGATHEELSSKSKGRAVQPSDESSPQQTPKTGSVLA